jgi:YD repeat-containing protein
MAQASTNPNFDNNPTYAAAMSNCMAYDAWVVARMDDGYGPPPPETDPQCYQGSPTLVADELPPGTMSYENWLYPTSQPYNETWLYWGGAAFVFPADYGKSTAKNLGDVCGCSGGNGSKGGGSGSGAGGSGSISVANAAGSPLTGDPINAATGNKYLQDDDYPDGGWLTFRRFYNSSEGAASSAIGTQWRHSFDRSLDIIGSPPATIIVLRPSGSQEFFTKSNGVWGTDPDVNDTLTEIDNAQGVATSYTLFVAALRQTETYSATGLLQSVVDETGQGIALTYSTSLTAAAIAPNPGLLLTVTDSQGRQLQFQYTAAALLSQVTLPNGGQLTYSHDSNGNLTSVQYPDGSVRQYVYNESSLTGGTNLIWAMTGIVDEAGTRYESTSYNSSNQATSSYFAGNVGETQFTYGSGTTKVEYPLGLTSTMSLATVQSVAKVASLSQPCGPQCGQPWKSITYDADGNPQTSVDFNGNTTATTYNSNNLLTQEVDAQGASSQRTTAFTWNTTLRVPLTRTVSNASDTIISSTQWVYNATGQTLARCDIDPTNSAASGYSCNNTGTVPAGVRRWTYTYCTAVGTGCPLTGLLLTATGPRTDVTQTTTYSYYANSSATSCGTPGAACYMPGDLYQVTDPLGHVTTIASYDADGRPTRITDANGINTDLTYTSRGWLASRTVGGAATTFSYTPYGAVQTITDPNGITTTYGYDAAHRLIKITDALGNSIQYTLDAAGDKTAEQVYDTSSTLHKQLTRTFNTLGQLTTVVDGLNNTVFNANASGSYDDNGNLIQSSDGLGIQRQMGYDALNRLVQTIDNYNGTN